VLAIGGEYGSGMIRLTLTAVPRRLTAFTAKALVTAAARARGERARRGRLGPGRMADPPAKGLIAANGYLPLSLGNAAGLRPRAVPSSTSRWSPCSPSALPHAVRDSAAGIGVVLGILLLLPIISTVIPDQALSRHLEQLSPMTAGLYIQVTEGVRQLPLTPWQGLGVTAAWAAGAPHPRRNGPPPP